MSKKPVIQGGVENYLGKQPQVVAPRKWQSSPDAPPTELAYITKAEKDLILKKDIHGSLSKGPNMGPSGIMSLDSFGDIGGAGAAGVDTAASGGANEGAGFSGKGPNETPADFKAREIKERSVLQNAENIQAGNLGYNARENIVDRTYGPLQKYTGRRRFFGGANKYGYTDVLPDGSLKPGFGGRFFGGLASLLTGVPLVGGIIGNVIDRGKGLFSKDYFDDMDDEEKARIDNLQLIDGQLVDTRTLDFDPNAKISDRSFTLNDPTAITNKGITATNQFDLSPYGRINDEDMVP